MTAVAEAPRADPLDEVERPVAHLLQARGGGLIGRLYARPELHRLVPTGLAVRLARIRGRLEWRLLSGQRRAAMRRAASLAGPGASPADVRRLAREHLVELAIQTELSWHPAAARRMPIHGLEHLERAREGGRGAILATIHMGPMLNLAHALAARGHRLYLSGGHGLQEPLPSGHHGRWVKTQNVWIEQAGCRWVRRGGSYQVLGALLRRGEVCWMNWDVGGHTVVPARLLGRTLHVGGGAARLAIETDACIVPGFVWREGDAQVAVVFPAIDPRVVAGESELNSRVASAVETALSPRLAQAQRGFAQRHDWRSPRPAAGRPHG